MRYRQGQLFRHVVLHGNTFEFNKVEQYIYYTDSVKDKIASLNRRGCHVVVKTGQQNVCCPELANKIFAGQYRPTKYLLASTGQQNVCWPELATKTRACETNLNTIFK